MIPSPCKVSACIILFNPSLTLLKGDTVALLVYREGCSGFSCLKSLKVSGGAEIYTPVSLTAKPTSPKPRHSTDSMNPHHLQPFLLCVT